MNLSTFVSQKMRFYSFLAMLLLVYVHGYNLQDNYLQPWTLVGEPMRFTTFTEYLLANGLFRFRIPMLFIISGYLYAWADSKPYGQRTLKRLRTLGIPFLLWSIISIVFTWALELSPTFLEAIKKTHLAQISEHHILVSQYFWYEWLIRIFLSPIAFQLWFIQALLFYNVAYPVLRWLATKNTLVSRIWFSWAILLWLLNISEGLLFFTLGIWLQKKNYNIEQATRTYIPRICLIVFVLLTFIKTYIAFQPISLLRGIDEAILPFFRSIGIIEKPEHIPYFYGFTQAFIVGILFKIAEILGVIGIWYGCDGLVRWAGKQRILVQAQDFSFIIYAAHVPILYYVMYLANTWLASLPYHRWITFVCIPFLIIVYCIILGKLLRTFTPKLYALLTGGRGL